MMRDRAQLPERELIDMAPFNKASVYASERAIPVGSALQLDLTTIWLGLFGSIVSIGLLVEVTETRRSVFLYTLSSWSTVAGRRDLPPTDWILQPDFLSDEHGHNGYLPLVRTALY